jgi:hemerythrin-like metal-binding protein
MLDKIYFPHLGMKTIDDEHKEIIFFLHQLKDSDNPIKIINTFVNYFTQHCDHEEELMRELDYPWIDYEIHKAEHQKMRDFFATLDQPEGIEPEKLREAIEESRLSLIKHINEWDAKLAGWIAVTIG